MRKEKLCSIFAERGSKPIEDMSQYTKGISRSGNLADQMAFYGAAEIYNYKMARYRGKTDYMQFR